jgi:hypothetical protein
MLSVAYASSANAACNWICQLGGLAGTVEPARSA